MTESPLKVLLLFGGYSPEHRISLRSALYVASLLDCRRYEVIPVGIDLQGRWYLHEGGMRLLCADDFEKISMETDPGPEVALLPRRGAKQLWNLQTGLPVGEVDLVFPILHGCYGEDGSVQGLAKLANLPCVGSGILGSSLCMDKSAARKILTSEGIAMTPARAFTRESLTTSTTRLYKELQETLGPRLFIKPANGGSSLGTSLVEKAQELESALEEAFLFDSVVLVETAVEGREIECAVLEDGTPRASLPGEIIPKQREGYTYESKYLDVSTVELCAPAVLDEAVVEQIQKSSIKAFKALFCQGMARVDFFLKKDGTLLLNEVNTIPGFTSLSLYPRLWEVSGVGPGKLIDKLIEAALRRFRVESRLCRAVPT